MNVEAEKLELIEMLLNIDQEEILLKIKEILHQNSSDISLSEEQKQLLDKRLEKHHLNPKEGANWQDFRKEIKSEYGL
jgi:putative addiction module component (TIGR02574 family)